MFIHETQSLWNMIDIAPLGNGFGTLKKNIESLTISSLDEFHHHRCVQPFRWLNVSINCIKAVFMYTQGGKRMMAGRAEKCGHDSGRIRSGDLGEFFRQFWCFNWL